MKQKKHLEPGTGFAELDRVLGGGLVKGSLVLLGGEPGIGKSTLILQICDKVKGKGQVLYVSGEESAEQIKSRADRLGIKNENILFLGETDIDIVNQAIINLNPKLVIIDSIQTMYSDEITAAAGSVSQVREITRTSHESMQIKRNNNNYNRTCYKRRKHSRAKSFGTYGRHCAISRRRKIFLI